MTAVPDRYLGVWRRSLLATRDGLRDESSAVYWLQTPHLHADLRLPLPRPVPETVLEHCSVEQARALASQQGFAGLTRVDGDICQWNRVIDYQPPSERPDIGRMRFENANRLLEDGLDDSYHEVWERLPDSRGSTWGIWLQAADGSPRQGCLLLAGDYFLFAAERLVPLRPGEPLGDQLAAANPLQRLGLLAFELSFGRHLHGSTPWLITHSSLPGRAGQQLLKASYDLASPDELPAKALSRLGLYAPNGGWVRADDPLIPAQETSP